MGTHCRVVVGWRIGRKVGVRGARGKDRRSHGRRQEVGHDRTGQGDDLHCDDGGR